MHGDKLASAAFAETATLETARAEPPQVVEYSASDDATGFSAAARQPCMTIVIRARRLTLLRIVLPSLMKKKAEVDTGVVLNNMPYILVLAVLAAGVAVFIIRKRRED